MIVYFAYHMEREYGIFDGSYYLTKKSIVKKGDILCIVAGSGRNPTTYRFYGFYEVKDSMLEIVKYKLLLAPYHTASSPILLNSQPRFDNKKFHNYYTCGRGIFRMKPCDVAFFKSMFR